VILRGSEPDELNRLVRLGMLHEDRPDDTRRVYYERITSPLWKIFESAAEAIEPG
jgi:hypothetical protein